VVAKPTSSWWFGKTPTGHGFFPPIHGKSYLCKTALVPTILPDFFRARQPTNAPNLAITPPPQFSKSQFADSPLSARTEMFTAELLNMCTAESQYTTLLSQFAANFINPLQLQDSDFKRSFLADPAVATILELFEQLR